MISLIRFRYAPTISIPLPVREYFLRLPTVFSPTNPCSLSAPRWSHSRIQDKFAFYMIWVGPSAPSMIALSMSILISSCERLVTARFVIEFGAVVIPDGFCRYVILSRLDRTLLESAYIVYETVHAFTKKMK